MKWATRLTFGATGDRQSEGPEGPGRSSGDGGSEHLSDGVPLVVADGQHFVLAAQRQQVLGTPAAANDPLSVLP